MMAAWSDPWAKWDPWSRSSHSHRHSPGGYASHDENHCASWQQPSKECKKSPKSLASGDLDDKTGVDGRENSTSADGRFEPERAAGLLLNHVVNAGGSRQVVAASVAALFHLLTGPQPCVRKTLQEHEDMMHECSTLGYKSIGSICKGLKEAGEPKLAHMVSRQHKDRQIAAHPLPSSPLVTKVKAALVSKHQNEAGQDLQLNQDLLQMTHRIDRLEAILVCCPPTNVEPTLNHVLEGLMDDTAQKRSTSGANVDVTLSTDAESKRTEKAVWFNIGNDDSGTEHVTEQTVPDDHVPKNNTFGKGSWEQLPQMATDAGGTIVGDWRAIPRQSWAPIYNKFSTATPSVGIDIEQFEILLEQSSQRMMDSLRADLGVMNSKVNGPTCD